MKNLQKLLFCVYGKSKSIWAWKDRRMSQNVIVKYYVLLNYCIQHITKKRAQGETLFNIVKLASI